MKITRGALTLGPISFTIFKAWLHALPAFHGGEEILMERPMENANDLAARAIPFVDRIENLDEELASYKGAYMARCKSLRDDRKEVFGEAKDAGIQVKPLKALIKRRKLEQQIADLPSDFDIDESAQYAALAEAFGDTPFGDHARARAAEARAEDLAF